MKKILFLFVLSVFLHGCKSTEDWSENAVVRPADENPEISYAPGLEPESGDCRTPLIDANDGTELTMVRSYNGMGDYEVPTGKYGLKSGELLRIECETGEVIGIVRM